MNLKGRTSPLFLAVKGLGLLKRKSRPALLFLLLLVLLAGGAAWYLWQMMQPVQAKSEPVVFTIEQGMSSSRIADLLEEKGLIRNALVFKGYVRWNNVGSGFQAGNYAVTPGADFDAIITKLSSGDVEKEEMLRFTIPEGYTVIQIADRLQEAGIADKEEFLKLANDAAAFGLPLADSIPRNDKLRYQLEGYLFPETYEVKKDSTVKDIVTVMLQQTQKELDSITDLETRLQERGESLHELMTVASLIEREVVVDEERPMVASVIYNRLKKGQRLEIDATVQYMLDKQKERLLFKDLEVDTPYNTYMYDGLPPGPISSPSLSAVEAALEPANTDYFYYVTKKDGTQGHLFGRTYQEHLRNIEASKNVTQ